MRKAEREIKDFEELVRLVGRCDTIRLGLLDEGAPYIVPLSFGYEVVNGKIALYFHGAVEGRKVDLIAKNRRVCVEGDLCHGFVDNGHGGLTCDFESFIGYGDCVLVSGEDAKKGIALLMAHCGKPEISCPPEVMAITAVYRIELDEVTGKRRFPR
jgi:nitroimidazol reductase NimA-like FMN-containing flavoprotein (pyridoxamine 5'-phosphate oxidase superfamily)